MNPKIEDKSWGIGFDLGALGDVCGKYAPTLGGDAMAAGACAAPMGAFEYAERATERIYDRTTEYLGEEIIRAREVGVREGEQRSAQQIAMLEKALMEMRNLFGQVQFTPPAYFSVSQKAYAASEAALKSQVERNLELRECNDRQRRTIQDQNDQIRHQTETIKDYHTRFEGILDSAACIIDEADPFNTMID